MPELTEEPHTTLVIPDSIGRDIMKACQGIYPLQDVYIRKVKVMKRWIAVVCTHLKMMTPPENQKQQNLLKWHLGLLLSLLITLVKIKNLKKKN